jgi:hypothetical protein
MWSPLPAQRGPHQPTATASGRHWTGAGRTTTGDAAVCRCPPEPLRARSSHELCAGAPMLRRRCSRLFGGGAVLAQQDTATRQEGQVPVTPISHAGEPMRSRRGSRARIAKLSRSAGAGEAAALSEAGAAPTLLASCVIERPAARVRLRKTRGTFSLTRELFEEIRDAAFHLSGPPLRLTMASVAEIALRRELNRMKLLHNGGRDFPRRTAELRGGRPIGSREGPTEAMRGSESTRDRLQDGEERT